MIANLLAGAVHTGATPRIRLTQIDGRLPNLALMKLAHWHRSQGHAVTYTRSATPQALEPTYDVVYGSAIFKYSAPKLARFQSAYPAAIVGGIGTTLTYTVDDVLGIGEGEYEFFDYTDHPEYAPSIGFTQRGCRMRCKFCVVPAKEGKNRSVNTIADIWRGPGHPKRLHLLDNDFFGQPEEQWRARIHEIREGDFRVCLNQGINVRLIYPAAADALATIQYRDDSFQRRRLYTAWDNLRDEAIFFRGIDTLEKAGIPPKHVMAYMLIGFDPDETLARFDKMVARGVLPYPMVYDCRATNPQRYTLLKQVQRWAVTGLYRANGGTSFFGYDPARKTRRCRAAPFPRGTEEAA